MAAYRYITARSTVVERRAAVAPLYADLINNHFFDVASVHCMSTEVHALAFMPHPWPLRAQLSNLNHKGGHAKGDPPQNECGTEGNKVGAPPPVFGGEGCWLNSNLSRILDVDAKKVVVNWSYTAPHRAN
eukprot:7106056-Ditylum_brightwellii.AAC.1